MPRPVRLTLWCLLLLTWLFDVAPAWGQPLAGDAAPPVAAVPDAGAARAAVDPPVATPEMEITMEGSTTAPGAPDPDPEPPLVVVRSRQPAAPPVRTERRLALAMDLTWNGLAGLGPILSFHALRHLSVDLGTGLSSVGFKLGARVRWDILDAPFTPFIGVGAMYGLGSGGEDAELDTEGHVIRFALEPSPFVMAAVGFDWTSREGFYMLGQLGYAHLLGGDNVVVTQGTPSEVQQKALDASCHSGPVLGVSLGYAFGF